ncbi:MAG: T9SS type A sorting domain-containing protein [Flavobacteriales bacterium]|nr:T9SS type A sorting domain-containing protein [Flavobacteriales bacterium]
MRKLLLLAMSSIMALLGLAQSDIEYYQDPYEVRLDFGKPGNPDPIVQQQLREAGAWRTFSQTHDGWYAIMSETHGNPQRAWGTPIDVQGASIVDKSEWLIANELGGFGISADYLSAPFTSASKKHERVRYKQIVSGLEVLQSEIVFKFHQGRLNMMGLNFYPTAAVPEGNELSEEQTIAAATNGVVLNLMETSFEGQYLLPTQEGNNVIFHLVNKIVVDGYEGTVPKKYNTLVDAQTGEVMMRQNMVVHIDPTDPAKKKKKVLPMGMAQVVSGQTVGTILEENVFGVEEELGLGYLNFELDGQAVTSDVDGNFITNITGPVAGDFALSGQWSTIYTAGVTPSFSMTVEDGYTEISFDDAATLRELSAYNSVNTIHDHMKIWLPDFTGLDESLTTNIDVEGECNAFYDGGSINFYPDGGGCNPTSLLSDVVYHEYGHGINGRYYQSQGANFNNGAMNEGYADFWGLSLTDSPLLGVGFYDDQDGPLRRYDIDPKIYPEDLIGQVHNDGEIICGAWWDSHVLMGGDWNVTMELFIETYDGLQATAQNGAEGNAYTNVLLDLLQADDDDGDLNNGTPNGIAIIEGFDIHGITLFSYAEIEHDPIEFANAEEEIVLVADADIVFPFGQYFESVNVFYRTEAGADWNVAAMDEVDNEFTYTVTGQDAMTVVEYYFAISDVFEGVSAVSPVAANSEAYPNLPFFTLVGVTPVKVHDSDDFSDFGSWDLGVPGDLAITGEWEDATPVGSTTDGGDPVAPSENHTDVFGGSCFLTGVSPGTDGGIGANDVDGGHTTLLSPVIDLSEYEEPVLAYWRWYVNGPAGGANPGSDWWQVEVSDDGGSNWVYLENTLTQDISWRRNAFKVSEYVDVTSSFQIRFIASDSTFVGENLDGGSLVEGAVDDIVLYDIDPGDNVAETAQIELNAFPNPTNGVLNVSISQIGGRLEVVDATGRLVKQAGVVTTSTTQLGVGDLPAGHYFLKYYLEDTVVRTVVFQVN